MSAGGAFVGWCAGTTAITVAAALLLSGSAETGAAVGTKEHGSSAVVSMVATVPAAGPSAATSRSAAGESPSSPVATPSVPNLGNAGLAVTVEPGETVRVLTADQWSALQPVFGDHTYQYARIAACESGINPNFRGIDVDGDVIAGAFSVKERLHGPVPVGLRAQSLQVLDIEARARAAGVPDPWASTRKGCAAWSR